MLFPTVGTYEGKSAQGIAIWEDCAYIFNDGGHCRVVDLKSGEITKEFSLASSGMKPHINAACFGAEKPSHIDIPVIYISETNTSPQRCFVEDISGDVSVLLQTIEAKENGKVYSNHNWVVDRENKFLYGINRRWHEYLDDEGNVKNIITKYRLPLLREGKHVTLTEKDILDRFEVVFANVMQDAVIFDDKLYIATGLHEMAQSRKGAKRGVVVVDLERKKIIKYINLSFITTNEPEGIDFWGKKCILFCGQNGGMHKVKY